MSRLTHKKSRKGCKRCKQRHVKCDETKPACLKCVTSDINCPYLDDPPSSPTHSSKSSPSSSIHTPTSSSSISVSNTWSFTSLSSQDPFHGVLNMAHLELFHHFSTNPSMYAVYQLPEDHLNNIMRETLQHALQAPYLMHELLSFAALHLSILNPSYSESWKHQSTELQTYALSLFNNKSAEAQVAGFIPSFLFASFLGTHLLHDAISSPASDFGSFLDRFVGYLGLARGVRMQLTGTNWASLSETSFRPLISVGNRIPHAEKAYAPELFNVEALLRNADISSSSLSIYLQVLKQLKSAYQAHTQFRNDKDAESKATARSAIFAWPILVCPDYTELLTQRRPEALAILAHYGVLLHWHKDLWVFGDGGKILIEGVEKYLGNYWEPWLEWPKGVLVES